MPLGVCALQMHAGVLEKGHSRNAPWQLGPGPQCRDAPKYALQKPEVSLQNCIGNKMQCMEGGQIQ